MPLPAHNNICAILDNNTETSRDYGARYGCIIRIWVNVMNIKGD